MTASSFASVELAPRDPILGVTEAFKADKRPDKANLGVGVYFDENGKIPLLPSVRRAEEIVAARQTPHGYQPIEGFADYIEQVKALLFGADSALLKDGRVACYETLGGTGALKVGADSLRRFFPKARAWISTPSWENHRAIFEYAGFEVREYAYYDKATHGLDLPAMLESLRQAEAGDIVVLHVCCHNPTGVDLTEAQWREVAAVCRDKQLLPFLDMAYQGFAEDTEADAVALRIFVESGSNLMVASSFSKSFSLYGERVGALSVVTQNADETQRVNSQIKRVIRSNYSNPPTFGGVLVATILATPELRQMWAAELAHMRDRIRQMREGLVERLNRHMKERGVQRNFDFIARQRGMFSFSGLSPEQVAHMQEHAGIYAVASGRICLAAISEHNIDHVAKSMADAIVAS